MEFGPVPLAQAEGAILAHSVPLPAGRLRKGLVLGAEDPHQFKPTQGTDLLAFFAGVFERTMRRWLS